jgi:hypothetical protein
VCRQFNSALTHQLKGVAKAAFFSVISAVSMFFGNMTVIRVPAMFAQTGFPRADYAGCGANKCL